MCIKTVIGRACKLFISSSDDGALFEDLVTPDRDPASAAAQTRRAGANMEEISLEEDFIPSQVIELKMDGKVSHGTKASPEPPEAPPQASGGDGALFTPEAGSGHSPRF